MIFFKGQPLNSIDEIYFKFGRKEFKSPFRSTIPLIVLYKNNQIPDFKYLNETPSIISRKTFEYQTNVRKGRGLPSCTDLMIENQDFCIAIESKRSEPPYQKVESWLKINLNRELVLEGWLEIINSHLRLNISLKEIGGLPYQLIHRVASACSIGKKDTIVLYAGFDLDEVKTNYYLNCLTKFSTILEDKVDLYLYCYTIEKTQKQIDLENLWNQKVRDLSEKIIDGLQKNDLMTLRPTLQKKISPMEVHMLT
ncbi:MAG: hypothetical protein EOO51_08375 [Flavobacterium sp.]|nr:MAG: hypothetical protein EOO51_08375 [Flavobacterium sp.]